MNARRLSRWAVVGILMGAVLIGCNLPISPRATPTPSEIPQTATGPAGYPATPTYFDLAATETARSAPETETPSPTAPQDTSVPSLAGPTAAPFTDTPSPTAPATLTPIAAAEKPARIMLIAPGAASKVVSPVYVDGQADPTFEQALVVQVSGEDGKVLKKVTTTIQADAGKRGPFSVEVPFTTARDQAGRISVYEVSPANGGLVALSSVEVTLLASGTAETKFDRSHPDYIRISLPAAEGEVRNGKLVVEGFSGPAFENNLAVVICGQGGKGAADLVCGKVDNIIASGSATIHAPDVGQPGPFHGEVEYTLNEKTSGRVVVFIASARDGGIVELASVPVTIYP